MSTKPTVEVVIINFNTPEDTLTCLKSVLKSDYQQFHITVLDNGSAENQIPYLSTQLSDHRVSFVRSDQNLGFAGGNNYIINQTYSDYVFLLNSDTTVAPDTINRLVKTLQNHKKAAAVQPKIKWMRHPTYFEYAGAAGGFIDQLGYPYAQGRVGFHLEEDIGQYDTITEVHWTSGAAMLVRRAIWNKIGGLDETFFFYHEETDWCWRARNAGYGLLCNPNTTVLHKGATSSRNLAKKIYLVHRNNLLLLLKNIPNLQLLPLLILRIFTDIAGVFFYLLTGKTIFMLSVVRANLSAYWHAPQIIIAKRKQSLGAFRQHTPFSILWYYFVLKKRKCSEITNGIQSTSKLIYYDTMVKKGPLITYRAQIRRLLISPAVIVPLTALVIVLSWYQTPALIASGEEALAWYDPGLTAKIYATTWYDTGTGYANPFMLSRAPFYALFGIFEMYIPNWLIQAVMWFTVLCSGTLGMYYCTHRLTRDTMAAVIAAIFYVLNPFTITQIIGRLLSNGYILWAVLPWLTIAWIQILRSQFINFKWILIFLITTVLGMNAFGHPANILVTGIYLAIIAFMYITPFSINRILSIFFTVLLALMLHWWWLQPILTANQSLTFTDNARANFDSLRGVSQYFPLETIIILQQKYLFTPQAFNGHYQHPLTAFITYLMLILLITAVVTWQNSRIKYAIVISLFLLLFLAKGTNQPLGYKTYDFLFTSITATQSLRNSYEKFGPALIVPYSLLTGIGAAYLLSKGRRAVRITGFTVLLLALFWYGKPMFNGQVFGADIMQTKVIVPDYYAEAAKWLAQQPGDGRILVVPMINGDGIRLNFSPYPFQGQEPSEFLFPRKTISKLLRNRYADIQYQKLYNALQNSQNISEHLTDMNVQFILHNKDIDPTVNNTIQHHAVTNYLTVQQIPFQKEVGNLAIYRVPSYIENSKFMRSDTNTAIPYIETSRQKYKLTLQYVTQPISIIMRETFDTGWQATLDNKVITEHIVYKEFANEWKIDKVGDYDIYIYR